MDEGEKKKKKEKAAVRGRQQKSQHISQPLSIGLWEGSERDSSSRALRVCSTHRARESKGSRPCRDPGCSQGGASTEALALRCA